MLIPLRRETFEELVPAVATADQYKHTWGKFPDILKRLLISAVAICVMIIISFFTRYAIELVIVGITTGGLYWLWGPVLSASLRNGNFRKFPYTGLWKGRVIDVYITEEVVSQEEKVNNRGQLLIVDNLESKINLEIGDKTGFSARIKARFQRIHENIQIGQVVFMVVTSDQPDLGRIIKISDLYLPQGKIWVGDYPYLRRDLFPDVINQMRKSRSSSYPNKPPSRRKPPSPFQ